MLKIWVGACPLALPGYTYGCKISECENKEDSFYQKFHWVYHKPGLC